MDLLGGDERKTRAEVEAHLLTEERQRAGAGAVRFAYAARAYALQQLEVRLHAAGFACATAKLPEGWRARYAQASMPMPARIIGMDSTCPSVSQPPAR